MFEELSTKINEMYYKAAVKMVKSMYSSCKSTSAWEPSNFKKYKECTNEIIESNSKIQNIMEAIEYYSLNHSGAIQKEFDGI